MNDTKTNYFMKIISIFLLLVSTSVFGQKTQYKLILKNPCNDKINNGVFYQLEKSGKVFYVNDSTGTIYLDEPGKYQLSAIGYGISQTVKIKEGFNIDTLVTEKIFKCYEPVSHPNFYGYCCCDEKCNGIQKDYYTDGTLRIEGEFKNGKAVGNIIQYHPNGNIKQIDVYSKKGLYRKTKYYDLDGKRIK